MKTKYSTICVSMILAMSICGAAPIKLNPKIQIPAYKSDSDETFPLKKLLEDGELLSFYKTAFYDRSRCLYKKFMEEQDKSRKVPLAAPLLAVYVMILAAPLSERKLIPYTPEWDTSTFDDNKDIDLKAKSEILWNLRYIVMRIKGETSQEAQTIRKVVVNNYAHAIRGFKDAYNPELTAAWREKKAEHFREEVEAEKIRKYKALSAEERKKIDREYELELEKGLFNYHEDPAIVIYSNKTRSLVRINRIYKELVTSNEERFIECLIEAYPDKRNKAWELIMDAGYTKEEIPALLNRTVGRNPKTEFLFPDTKKK